jgi:chromosome partitioning protein
MAKIISVCSEKGGVGKTTSAINIASGLVQLGKKVLVLDLDQQGNASRLLGFERDGRPTTSELIYNTIAEAPVEPESFIRSTECGVDYIPASPLLTGITTFMANDVDNNYIIKRALENETFQSYDYILMDCRTLLDLLVSNAMNASDSVIIPVESGMFSFDGLEKLLGKVKSLNGSTNKTLKVLGILLNKQQRTNISTSIADAIREEYGDITFKTGIPFCPAQSENAVLSQTASVNDKSSSMGQAFMAVAQEVIEKAEVE